MAFSFLHFCDSESGGHVCQATAARVEYPASGGSEGDRPETRIGISVSKKVGNSVVRHHITRLLRESFRLHEDITETGLDIVVVARAAAKEESYKTIESAYLHLCGLHNILKKESK